MSTRSIHGAGAGAAVLSIVLMAGCEPAPATVKGTVTYKGAPVPTGEVFFHCEGGTVRSGPIGALGGYQVDRCPPGEARVRVIAQRATPRDVKWKLEEMPLDASVPAPKITSIIPKRYESIESTNLRPVLAPGLQKLDLELTD